MNVRILTGAMLVSILSVATVPASAQLAGWVASRANCYNDESFTYRVTLIRAHWFPIPIPSPAPRRTLSYHHDRLNHVTHSVESSSGLVNTWRSAAVHLLEGVPTIVGYRFELRPVVSWGNFCDQFFDDCYWHFGVRWEWVYVPSYMYDRWQVDGKHWEDLGSGQYVRHTSVTDCAWLDTFNLLGS